MVSAAGIVRGKDHSEENDAWVPWKMAIIIWMNILVMV
jgi:hypothetical protein